jgi:hypothetical protein
MESSDSGIFKIGSVGNYIDALPSTPDEMSLRERSNLIFLDKRLHQHWCLGHNVMLNWCPHGQGIHVLIVPHYALARYGATSNGVESSIGAHDAPSERFLQSLLSGRRQVEPSQLNKVARLLSIAPTYVPLEHAVTESTPQQHLIEKMIKRYSISYTPSRAVALFDIVGFGLLNPFEQMLQLNSLSYSLNSAQSKLSSKKLDVDFARSTTGDGFYVWNRDLTLECKY